LSYPSFPVFRCAVLAVMLCHVFSVLSWLSCHRYPAQFSSTSCPVLAILFRPSYPACSVPAVLSPSLLSFLSFAGCPVPDVLSGCFA
jgi:hypothetical protein